MINCSKSPLFIPLVFLAGCLGAQALFSAVLVVWISFFLRKISFPLLSGYMIFEVPGDSGLRPDQNYSPGSSKQNRISIQIETGIGKCQAGEEKLLGQ